MKTFRQTLFGRLTGVLCVFLILFNSTLSVVAESLLRSYEDAHRIPLTLFTDDHFDALLQELKETRGNQEESLWTVINEEDGLDTLSFSQLKRITQVAKFENEGVLQCLLDSKEPSQNSWDFGYFINQGELTLIDTRENNPANEIGIIFKKLVNGGTINLEGSTPKSSGKHNDPAPNNSLKAPLWTISYAQNEAEGSRSARNRVGGEITSPVLSHHRTCDVAYGGFNAGFTQLSSYVHQA